MSGRWTWGGVWLEEGHREWQRLPVYLTVRMGPLKKSSIGEGQAVGKCDIHSSPQMPPKVTSPFHSGSALRPPGSKPSLEFSMPLSHPS